MIVLNLKKHMADMGVENAEKFLRAHGFTRNIARKLIYNQGTHISFDQIEKLCYIFNATPNDLLKWTPPVNGEKYKDHPLQKLKRVSTGESLGSKIRRLNPEELEQLRTYIDNISNEEKESN